MGYERDADNVHGFAGARYWGPTTPVHQENRGLYTDRWHEHIEARKRAVAEESARAIRSLNQAAAAKAARENDLRRAVVAARQREAMLEIHYLQHSNHPPAKEAWLRAVAAREAAERELTAP